MIPRRPAAVQTRRAAALRSEAPTGAPALPSLRDLPLLHTERLTIRPLTLDDLDDFAAIFADQKSMEAYRRTFSPDESRGWLERSLTRYERDGFVLFAVVRTEDGVYLGDCEPSIQMVEGVEEVEIGWHVRRDLRGRGYATEAATVLRDWVFDVLGRDRLISLVEPSNTPRAGSARRSGCTSSVTSRSSGHCTAFTR